MASALQGHLSPLVSAVLILGLHHITRTHPLLINLNPLQWEGEREGMAQPL